MPTGLVDLAQHFRFAEGRFGVKDPRLGSRNRNTDLCCRFLHRTVFQYLKLKSTANRRAKVADCVFKNSSLLSLCAPSFGIWGGVRYFPQRLVYTRTVRRNFARITLLPKDHQRRIDPNACQPGRESGSSVEALEMKERPQERVLHRIFGVFTVSSYAMHSAKELFRVCSIERVERRSFSALCCCQQASFLRARHLL